MLGLSFFEASCACGEICPSLPLAQVVDCFSVQRLTLFVTEICYSVYYMCLLQRASICAYFHT